MVWVPSAAEDPREVLAMTRILQTLRLGPHSVDVVQLPDDEGGGVVAVVIDSVIVTEPPLDRMPSTDEVLAIYATWAAASARSTGRPPEGSRPTGGAQGSPAGEARGRAR